MCDLCGEISNNNGTKMSNNQEKSNGSMILIFIDKVYSRFLSIKILIPIIVNEISTTEIPTKASNKFNVNAKTEGLDGNPLFTECVFHQHKSYSFHKKVTEGNEHETYDGSTDHLIGFWIETIDAVNRILDHKLNTSNDHTFIHACMFLLIFVSKFEVLFKFSFARFRRDDFILDFICILEKEHCVVIGLIYEPAVISLVHYLKRANLFGGVV